MSNALRRDAPKARDDFPPDRVLTLRIPCVDVVCERTA